MNYQTRVAILIFSWTLFASCNYDKDASKQAIKDISTQVEELSRSVGDYVRTAEVPEEFKKLQQYEYQVLTWPVDVTAKELENRLVALGKERWDCAFFQRTTRAEISGELVTICKRRPDTPLKYVPKTLIGG